MSSKMLTRVAMMATAALGLSASAASAQIYDPCCNPCCAPMQPVLQTQYRTVPVTEMQQVKQTVRRPQYRTEYVNEPVTTYRPVTERVVRNVPSVQYQTVTQYRTVHRDMGRWMTSYQPNPRVSPCQVDGRPGFIGWMNRTRHELTSAFQPRYTSSRHYQPNVVAYSVPYTRQVAVPTTRQVAYNVTRMVPTQTVQRRAVQRLSYVDEEVTVMRPRTTYRTVPIGTAVAYAPAGSTIAYGGSAIATAPGSYIRSARVVDDRVIGGGSSRTALSPEPDDNFNRSADSNRRTERAAERDLPDPSSGGGVSSFASPYRRESPARISASAEDFSESAGSVQPVGGLRPYRRGNIDTDDVDRYERAVPSRPTPAPPGETTLDNDPFGGEDMFGGPAASIPRVRESDIRTTTQLTGWKPSRSVRQTHRVPKPVLPEIPAREIARR